LLPASPTLLFDFLLTIAVCFDISFRTFSFAAGFFQRLLGGFHSFLAGLARLSW
jgi:hypothetical protein